MQILLVCICKLYVYAKLVICMFTAFYAYAISLFAYPFESQRRVYSRFDQNFDFKIRREHEKISL